MLIPGPFWERLTLVWLVPLVWLVWVDLGASFSLVVLMSDLSNFIPEPEHFSHRLSAKLSGHRARSIECSATSGLKFWIWMAMHPNLSMNFWRNSSSACCKLASAANVMRCDRLVAYCALKHSTRVSKLLMDVGGSLSYQVNVSLLRDIRKTRHMIASSLVYRFSWVRKASRCSSGSVVPSYRSRLSSFQPKGMSTSMMQSKRGVDDKSALLDDVCRRDLDHLECWLCVGGVIPLGCAQAICWPSAHHREGVLHKPRADYGEPSSFSTLPYGIVPFPQYVFGVAGRC